MSTITSIKIRLSQQGGSMGKVTLRIAAYAARNETSNADISRRTKDLLESHFGGNWLAFVGTDFAAVFSSGEECVEGTMAHYAISRENEDQDLGIMMFQTKAQ